MQLSTICKIVVHKKYMFQEEQFIKFVSLLTSFNVKSSCPHVCVASCLRCLMSALPHVLM